MSTIIGPDWSAPATADVLLVPPVSPQLIANLRSAFPEARVVVTEIEDDELGVSYHGPVRRLLDAGAEAYLPATSVPRLARQLDHTLTHRGELTGGSSTAPEIEPTAPDRVREDEGSGAGLARSTGAGREEAPASDVERRSEHCAVVGELRPSGVEVVGRLPGMLGDDLPVEVDRSVELFLTAVDELAPGLVTGFYLVGSVALGDFHATGAGRGRLSTASDIDFVAVTDRRVEPGSREMAAVAEAHGRTVARFPRPE
ncbi:hypothetical protein GCM10010129_06740 [Streptomyces fumigatiscleroticus]|nr:hypothetical protein GCM10010129_06740 [Streptomyces fumigatiscleroticus]